MAYTRTRFQKHIGKLTEAQQKGLNNLTAAQFKTLAAGIMDNKTLPELHDTGEFAVDAAGKKYKGWKNMIGLGAAMRKLLAIEAKDKIKTSQVHKRTKTVERPLRSSTAKPSTAPKTAEPTPEPLESGMSYTESIKLGFAMDVLRSSAKSSDAKFCAAVDEIANLSSVRAQTTAKTIMTLLENDAKMTAAVTHALARLCKGNNAPVGDELFEETGENCSHGFVELAEQNS